ncbi:hypothetical protein BKA66DRAFT_477688 [Pyrenochaeta sp. MPI-SDFR-AT-0127]|nr:hypothetical protein BKA66DRAFT_477688 [Pyrenochaeta sp. MPI-SDFR-AT-0127]
MAGSKILVLGGTGPAGICLLRELVYRKHAVVVYARTPSKIPKELADNSLIEIVKGEMNDTSAFSIAMAQCSIVLSLLGPQITDKGVGATFYVDMYKNTVIPAMRQHGVRRIVLMGTVSIKRPEDHWTAFQTMVTVFMRLLAASLYRNITGIADLFDSEANDLDWTIFRIAQIPGENDEASWLKGREDGKVYNGWVGAKGWTSSINRSALARWLVDAAEGGANDWVRKMPAVGKLAGS